jgi:hypothetical protein
MAGCSELQLRDESCSHFGDDTTGLVLPSRGSHKEFTVQLWIWWVKETHRHEYGLQVLQDSLCFSKEHSADVPGLKCNFTQDNYLHFQLQHSSSNKLSIGMSLSKNSPVDVNLAFPSDFIDKREKQWSHLAVTYSSGENSKVEFILNGELVYTKVYAQAKPVTLSMSHVGDWPGYDRGFNGCMRELQFWKRRRSAEEIRTTMLCRANASDPDLIAAYPLKHNLVDSSPSRYDAAGASIFATPMDLWHQTQQVGGSSKITSKVAPMSADGDCTVAGWNEWSPCSKSCGAGFQVQEPHIVELPKPGGKQCPSMNIRSCNTVTCTDLVSHLSSPGGEDVGQLALGIGTVVLALAALIIYSFRKKTMQLARELDTVHELQFEMSNTEQTAGKGDTGAGGFDGDKSSNMHSPPATKSRNGFSKIADCEAAPSL